MWGRGVPEESYEGVPKEVVAALDAQASRTMSDEVTAWDLDTPNSQGDFSWRLLLPPVASAPDGWTCLANPWSCPKSAALLRQSQPRISC